MKKFILGMVLYVVLMFAGFGCEESLTPADIQALAARQEVLQQQLDTAQAAATKITKDLADAGIVDPNVVAKVAKLNEEADRVQAQIDVIARALQGVLLTGDAVQDFIAQLQAANVASAGFNPYVIPVGTGLTILSIVLGWFARRNAAAAAKEKLKYQAHKQGVEKTMIGKDAELQKEIYENIGESRIGLNVK